MFTALPAYPEDAILRLMALYRDDPRKDKIDLGVGVYRDEAGRTPVMRAVRAAEKQLWQDQDTKSYVGLLGAPDFANAMTSLVLGTLGTGRIAAAATPGGTGALRIAFDLVALSAPDAAIWLPAPTWPNHESILAHLKRPVHRYRYAAQDGTLDAAGMLEDLSAARAGDVVLLHGCCHNPTGIDPDRAQWSAVADCLAAGRLLPLVDLAYLGFGDGLDADAAPVRMLAERCPEMLVAVSGSKTFGVYRDRAGVLLGLAEKSEQATALRSALAHLNRQTYSFPPDHGARIVTMVLNDPALREDWQVEIDGMRIRINSLRGELAAGLKQKTRSDRFATIATQRGMFSRLGLSPRQVEDLRARHSVYIVGDGRINIAGLNAGMIPTVCERIADVL
ncbi:amino acid aminotransferase [Meridianimarinicoccus aquatilis]|uniref:Aspartate/tyrosine/aromatic aminotransferase n=1 Tax=Meridianimarinicoccus aquatilis TaxID=2552766 RepID=A0A4R6AVS1_9RHOB|nr:amino acid aminotransferase [Fluviibacterium aquatile]TDL86898.1 aspartate/tyrosine/aromatic aminotransferase [Fluviibacterium aquatile]